MFAALPCRYRTAPSDSPRAGRRRGKRRADAELVAVVEVRACADAGVEEGVHGASARERRGKAGAAFDVRRQRPAAVFRELPPPAGGDFPRQRAEELVARAERDDVDW